MFSLLWHWYMNTSWIFLASKCLQHIELCCKKIPRSLPTRVGSYSMWRLNGLKMLYKDFTPTNNALNDENVQASWCLSSIFEAAWTKIHFWPGLPDKGNTLQQRQQSNAMDINDPTQTTNTNHCSFDFRFVITCKTDPEMHLVEKVFCVSGYHHCLVLPCVSL